MERNRSNFALVSLLLFFVFLMGEIVSALSHYTLGIYFFKPLLMPLLGIFYFLETKISDFRVYFILFFSWLGDVFLMFQGYFIPGLVGFLIAHIFYILVFLKNYSFKNRFSLAILLYGGIMTAFLYPYIEDNLKIPVFIYICVIVLMGFLALNRSNNLTRLGALLFIISDSAIAIDKFVEPIDFSPLIIMTTYGFAQYFLIKSLT